MATMRSRSGADDGDGPALADEDGTAVPSPVDAVSCVEDPAASVGGAIKDEDRDTHAIIANDSNYHHRHDCTNKMESKDKDDDKDDTTKDDDSYFADVGFMFEASQPTRRETYRWTLQNGNDDDDDKDTLKDTTTTRTTGNSNNTNICVVVHCADDDAGAVQSGHYLWPAAHLLADYLVQQCSGSGCDSPSWTHTVQSVLELGAGCGLASLTALQLWPSLSSSSSSRSLGRSATDLTSDNGNGGGGLRCLVCTDHDPGTCVRAKDNWETTLQCIMDETVFGSNGTATEDTDDENDEKLNAIINSMASIPVFFEPLEWGAPMPDDLRTRVQEAMGDSTATAAATTKSGSSVANSIQCCSMDVVLGSDLIYALEVVEPLLWTARQWMGYQSRFLLSQSFRYDALTEAEIDRVCGKLGLRRTILVDDDSSTRRIQEFVLVEPEQQDQDDDDNAVES